MVLRDLVVIFPEPGLMKYTEDGMNLNTAENNRCRKQWYNPKSGCIFSLYLLAVLHYI